MKRPDKKRYPTLRPLLDLKSESGQALTEYVVVAFWFLITAVGTWNYLIPELIAAYGTYLDAHYFILNMP